MTFVDLFGDAIRITHTGGEEEIEFLTQEDLDAETFPLHPIVIEIAG